MSKTDYKQEDFLNLYSGFDIEVDEKIKIMIDNIIDGLVMEDLKINENEFELFCKKFYVHYFDNEAGLREMTDKQLKFFVDLVEDLVKIDDISALSAKAWGHYSGNRAFKCNWKESERLLLKLVDIADDPCEPANALGYIYYYGRVNDGNPQYDKAFKYFSIGAAGGYHESQYKIGDMFLHGYEVPKNSKVALDIYKRLYEETRNRFLNFEFCTKFPDIALRYASFYKDYILSSVEEEDALYLLHILLEAKLDISIRREEHDYFGDEIVEKSINDLVDEMYSYIKPADKDQLYNEWTIHCFEPQDKDLYNVQMIFEKQEDCYDIKIEFEMKDDKAPKPLFMEIIPKLKYENLVSELHFKADPDAVIKLKDENIDDKLVFHVPTFEAAKSVLENNIEGKEFEFIGNYRLVID